MANDTTPEDIESTIRIDSQALVNEKENTSEDILSPDTFDEVSDFTFSDTDTDDTIILPTQESINFDELNDEIEAMDNPSPTKSPTTSSKTQEKTTPKAEKEQDMPHIDLTNEMLISDSNTPPSSEHAQSKQVSKGIGFIWASMIFISFIIGAAGIWMAMNAQARVDELALQLEFMENTSPQITDQQSGSDEELMDMHEQLDALEQQFTILKVQLAHNTSNPSTSEPANLDSKTKVSPVVITPVTSVASSTAKHVATPTAKNSAKTKKTAVKPTVKPSPKALIKASPKEMPKPITSAWQVVVSSHNSMKKAKTEQNKASIKAMHTSIQPVTVKGKQWYRVVATGFNTKQQAIDFTKKLKQQGIPDAWVQHIKH